MNPIVLKLYHNLPPFARNIAASLRGYYLHPWRYGPETERLVEEALERDTWSVQKWKTYQETRLSYLLVRAATKVPYYRDQWLRRRRNGDKSSWDYLENWQILNKDELRLNPQSFVADDCDVRKMWVEHTSGTTGTPLTLWMNRDTIRAWYALFEARWRRWYGVSLRDRWAILGGQLVVPTNVSRPPFWVWNSAFHQLYMSSYHLSPALIVHYLNALERFQVQYIYAYTSSIYLIAQEALRQKRNIPLKVVMTNAEPLYSHQREVISRAFSCPVRETYGMSELVGGASECQEGKLHIWPDAGILETATPNDANASAGELICTGLINSDMPLIRYRVGDTVAWSSEVNCKCNRSLPILASIEGRTDDLLHTRDGRTIGRLDPVFKADFPIQEAQIVQKSLDLISVYYVPSEGFAPTIKEQIREQLCSRLGECEVEFLEVSHIPRTANGKFKAVVCALTDKEKRQARGITES
ncbi:MAG: phenylacetate--CoA ligase family protein [Anaerolineae bacterium]|nr:phenylacetate--CoA ligase family protein [Anaerolineae bacterium]